MDEPMDEVGYDEPNGVAGFSAWAGYEFDPAFFEEHEGGDRYYGGGDRYAVFKIVPRSGGGDPKYLHIYNWHNGYYSHGFEMKVGGEATQVGSL